MSIHRGKSGRFGVDDGPKDLDKMSVPEYIAFVNSKVDVKDFFRKQGINLDDDF